MKKIYSALMLAAAVVATSVSCTKENYDEQNIQPGKKLVFSGSTVLDTKVSIGEKDGGVYPLLWQEGDAISLWSENVAPGEPDGEGNPTVIGNLVGEQAQVWSGSTGKTSGVFQTNNPVSLSQDENIVILYPASSLTYSEGVISATVPEFQEQRGSNSSIHIGKYAVSYDKILLKAEQTEDVTFHLNQKTAFVKLVLSTSEYSSMQLAGASLTCAGEKLSGAVKVKVEDGTLSSSATSDRVGVKYRTPVPFSQTQEVYFTALPCDLTGKECILTVSMTDGSKTVTIPAKINGGKLEESKLSVITLNNISRATVDCDWYEPEETRDLLDAWAYGPQNTYLIEQKASGSGDTEIKIDVKARGDFSKVRQPKYYGLYSGSSEMSSRQLIHLPGDVAAYEEMPVNTVSSDWTITVYAYDQSKNGRWATVALYDEDYNIIWSYMIMKYIEGDEPGDVAYPGTDIVLLDRNLGATYSNAKAEELKTFDNAGAFFQWGRKDPFMWSNSGIDNRYNLKLAAEGSDISTAISNPGTFYSYNKTPDTRGDWQATSHRTDLWGGENNTTDWYDPSGVGHKTIYDPCPAGYRVPDAKVLQEVGAKAERWEISNGLALQDKEAINSNSPFASTFSTLAYPLGEGKYDYWPYAGAKWGSNNNWGNRTASPNKHAAIYWANSVDPTATNVGVMLEYCYFSAEVQMNNRHTSSRAHGFAIRCQKE